MPKIEYPKSPKRGLFKSTREVIDNLNDFMEPGVLYTAEELIQCVPDTTTEHKKYNKISHILLRLFNEGLISRTKVSCKNRSRYGYFIRAEEIEAVAEAGIEPSREEGSVEVSASGVKETLDRIEKMLGDQDREIGLIRCDITDCVDTIQAINNAVTYLAKELGTFSEEPGIFD